MTVADMRAGFPASRRRDNGLLRSEKRRSARRRERTGGRKGDHNDIDRCERLGGDGRSQNEPAFRQRARQSVGGDVQNARGGIMMWALRTVRRGVGDRQYLEEREVESGGEKNRPAPSGGATAHDQFFLPVSHYAHHPSLRLR